MKFMFRSSKATILDLGSFDITNGSYIADMFKYSADTTGYARTQVDADKFNNSSNKPTGLTFVVR